MAHPLLAPYGEVLRDFPFEVVSRHWLADDEDRPPEHRSTYCDLYWASAIQPLVALVSIEAARGEALVSYHRKDDEIGHRFFVATSVPVLDRSFVVRVLQRLDAWCVETRPVWEGRGELPSRIIIRGEV